MKLTGHLISAILALSLFSCRPEEITLHGDITGSVRDEATGSPINQATILVNHTNIQTSTDTAGRYLLKGLVPGVYEIIAKRTAYADKPKDVSVSPGKTQVKDFLLQGIPTTEVNVKYLDFGLDSTQLYFTISNTSINEYRYFIHSSQQWISVNPDIGDLTANTDTITVTINKSMLEQKAYKNGTIVIESIGGQNDIDDILIDVYANGVMDFDTNYYNVVKIGDQTWMAENLNVGSEILVHLHQIDNGTIEKYHIHDLLDYNNLYGGLYQWDEMMQYRPSDNKKIGTTQGICPDGWHIPTVDEWQTLVDHLGGAFVAGGKLKAKEIPPWRAPNLGATNESGFSGLPGGNRREYENRIRDYEEVGYWWSSTIAITPNDVPYGLELYWDNAETGGGSFKFDGRSVRCVKNLVKP